MIAIVEKISNDSSRCERLLERNVNSSYILNRYSGFEGSLIECLDSSDIDEDISLLKDEMETLYAEKAGIRLLSVSPLKSHKITVPKRSVFLGFDLGIFDTDLNLYSSIFQEVLFGIVPELINFTERLNDYGLFPSTSTLNEYTRIHKDLYINGFDVEHHDLLSQFSICEFNL